MPGQHWGLGGMGGSKGRDSWQLSFASCETWDARHHASDYRRTRNERGWTRESRPGFPFQYMEARSTSKFQIISGDPNGMSVPQPTETTRFPYSLTTILSREAGMVELDGGVVEEEEEGGNSETRIVTETEQIEG